MPNSFPDTYGLVMQGTMSLVGDVLLKISQNYNSFGKGQLSCFSLGGGITEARCPKQQERMA